MSIVKAKTNARGNPQKGYMLLAVMLLVTMMLLALTIVLPRVAQQIKREKEEELVHRGKEYALAIKRYYHAAQVSHNTYPSSLDQLESANNLRFLRKRFKDPMTVDGEWRLIHFGEAEIQLIAPTGVALPGGAGPTGGLQTSPISGSPSPTPTVSPGPGAGAFTPPGAGGQLGALATTTSPVQGGGFIIGVASKSKETSIKEFNGSNQYDQWLFVYDPRLECQQPAGISATPLPCQGNGIAIVAPRSGGAPPGNPPGPLPSVSPTLVPPNPSPTPPQPNPQ